MKIIDDLKIETVNLKICCNTFAEDLSSGSLMSKNMLGLEENSHGHKNIVASLNLEKVNSMGL